MAKITGPEGIQDVNIQRDPGLTVPEGMWADAKGHDVFTAVERFGARGEQLASALAEERQNREDAAFVSAAETAYAAKSRDMLRKMQAQTKDGAVGFTDSYRTSLEKLRDEVEAETKTTLRGSSRALAAYRERAARANISLIEHAATYEDRERKQFYRDGVQRQVDEIGIMVGKGQITRDDALARAGSILANGSESLLPNELRDVTDKAKRIVAVSHYMGLAERNPGAVLALLKGRKGEEFAAEGLKPEDIRRIDAAADAAIRRGQQAAALNLSVTNEHLRTYSDFREKGIPVPPQLEATIQSLTAGGNKRVTEARRRYDSMRQYYDTVDASRNKPIPELRKDIETIRGDKDSSREMLAASLALEKQLQADTRREALVYKELHTELRQLAIQGAELDREKIGRMVQIGKDLSAPGYEAEAMRLVTIAENVAEAKRSPATGVADIARRTTMARDMWGEEYKTPDALDLAERNAIGTALRAKIAERDEDPRAYVDRYYPEVGEALRSESPEVRQAAVGRLLALQAYEGVLTPNRALLSKPEATEIEGRIKETTGRDRAGVIVSLVNRYGAQNWPLVQRQLDKGENLPKDAQIIAALPWGQGRDEELALTAVNLAEAYKLTPDKLKDLGFDKTAQDRINSGAISKMAPLQETFRVERGGLVRAAKWNDAAQTLASYYMATQKLSEGEAVTKATNEIALNFYEPIDRVRVPRTLDRNPVFVAGVRAKMDFFGEQAQLDKLDYHPGMYMKGGLSSDPKIADKQIAEWRRQFVTSIATKGYWATRPDGKGFRRYTDQGTPVLLRTPDGSQRFLEYDFYAPPVGEGAFWERYGTAQTWGDVIRRQLGDDPAALMRRWPQAPTRPGMEP